MLWVKDFKYLGIHFNAHIFLDVNVTRIKCKFYAALNSLLCKCKLAAEPVKLQLVKSFCLPLLMCCIGAVELKAKALHSLSICWNDAFRKIFCYRRSESVKELMYYVKELDFVHMYDLARMEFLNAICIKSPVIAVLYSCSESRFHVLRKLNIEYNCMTLNKSVRRSNVLCHFENVILSRQ